MNIAARKVLDLRGRPLAQLIGTTYAGFRTALDIPRRLWLKSDDQLLRAVVATSHDLDLPAGTVVFGHTHQPWEGRQPCFDQRWQFINTGAWVYDHMVQRKPELFNSFAPGHVVRVEADRAELVQVLPHDHAIIRKLVGNYHGSTR